MKPTDSRQATGHPGGHGHQHDPAEMHNEDVAHEHSDINVRALVVFCVGLAAMTVGVFALMYALFWGLLVPQAAANEPQVSPVAVPAVQMPRTTTGSPQFGNAPGPRLLTNEYGALEQHRQHEDQNLNGYAWADEKAGIARMPVAEAKKLILERGLPTRAGEPVNPTLGTGRPSRGEASSGRNTTGEPRGTGLPDLSTVPAPPANTGAGTERKSGGH